MYNTIETLLSHKKSIREIASEFWCAARPFHGYRNPSAWPRGTFVLGKTKAAGRLSRWHSDI